MKRWPISVEVAAVPGEWLQISVLGIEPKGLNGHSGLLRQNWRKRASENGRYRLILGSRGQLPKFDGPVDVTYWRSYFTVPMDEDNLAASFKPIGDALVALGVVSDDSSALLRLTPRQAKRGASGPRFRLHIIRRKV